MTLSLESMCARRIRALLCNQPIVVRFIIPNNQSSYLRPCIIVQRVNGGLFDSRKVIRITYSLCMCFMSDPS